MPKKLPVQFSQVAPKSLTRPHIDLVRCPPTSTAPLLITADMVIGTQIYWMGGRSCPHYEASPEQTAQGIHVECPGCDAGKHHRFVGWLTCFDERKLQHVILEVSHNASEQIGTYRNQFGTLRGSRIVLSRKNGRFNGTMTATLCQSGLPIAAIPIAFDLVEQLEFLWQAPNKTDRAVIVTPREIPAKEPRRKTEPAEVQKIYTATPAQLEMLRANKTAAKSRLADSQLDDAVASGAKTRSTRAAANPDDSKRMTKAEREAFQEVIAQTQKSIKQTNGHKTR